MVIGDGVVTIYEGNGADQFGSEWTGVCCDSYDVKSFWYVGRDHLGERTFNKLVSNDYLQAVQEARNMLVATRAFETYSGAQSLVRVDSESYASTADAQDALTVARASKGYVFGFVDELRCCTVTFYNEGGALPGQAVSRVFGFTGEAPLAIAA